MHITHLNICSYLPAKKNIQLDLKLFLCTTVKLEKKSVEI